ncbi:response regulator, partial [Enterovibrio norvegicus]
MHILIVEDEPKISQLIADYLVQSNYQVTQRYDGSNVIPWVEENNPDLILMDLMLPVIDGLTLCKEIRTFSNVPIIM